MEPDLRATPNPGPEDAPPRPSLSLPWTTLTAATAAGALVVALSAGLFSSPLVVVVALLCASVLCVATYVVSRRTRRPRGTRLPEPWLDAFETPPPARGPAQAARPPLPPVPEPADETDDDALASLWPVADAGQPAPPERTTIAAAAVAVAQELAEDAVRRLRAPAAAVLVQRGKRLVAAATAGDWALARRLQSQPPGASPGAPAPPPAPQPQDAAPDGGAGAPEFPLDDFLPRFLGLYPRAVPVERWHDLSDAPLGLLPLAALADGGTGVAVALRHRRQLAGLWILARRPEGAAYTDAELSSLERLARKSGPLLAEALAGE